MRKSLYDSKHVYGIIGNSGRNYVFKYFELNEMVPDVPCVFLVLNNNPAIDKKYISPLILGETESLANYLTNENYQINMISKGCNYIGIMPDLNNSRKNREKTLNDLLTNPSLYTI